MAQNSSPQTIRPVGPFARLGRLCVTHRWPVLISYLILLVVCGVFGTRVFGNLQGSGFDDPGSDSAQVAAMLADGLGGGQPVIAVVAVETPTGIDSPADARAAKDLLARVGNVPGVDSVVSYWNTAGAPPLRGTDGKTGLAVVYGTSDGDLSESAKEITKDVSGDQGTLRVYVHGGPVISNAFNSIIPADLAKAEGVAIPITVLVLLFVLGSVVAAGLPFLVAGGAILGSFTILWVITWFTDVSIFSVNLLTGLGLALGIDYALLAINRFREELAAGRSTDDAVVTMVCSSGKAIFVSGITVALTLASLLVFPQYFLKSFAYAGIAVSLVAVASALTALPAALAILGPNVNKWKVRRGDLAPKDTGAWSHIARFVMRRPWPVLAAALAVLLVMAMPAVSAVFGQVDERSLPADHPAAVAGKVIDERFPSRSTAPYEVILLNPAGDTEVAEFARSLARLEGVVRVSTPTSSIGGGLPETPQPHPDWRSDGAMRIQIIGDVDPTSDAGQDLTSAIRAMPAPAGDVIVGGRGAEYADAIGAISGRLWLVGLWIAATTLIALFLYTGSVLIPIKALILNVLSLAATLGALVWAFGEHHLTWLTGDYVQTGELDISTLALIAVTAFALSLDYEVFMLSRITEEHRAGRNTEDAVAFGLQRSGRIVTAAALMIAIVFASFLTSSATNIKQLGFGVTVAILVDATIVRALLVPAFMRIAGSANWWAPEWLRRVHDRVGISEG